MTTGVRDPREIARWDEEADVLVVGLGAAGAAVALEASRAGAETLVLERAGGGGGTSAMSGGVLYLGGGTALQKACGFEDTPEAMFRYLMASCGEPPNDDGLVWSGSERAHPFRELARPAPRGHVPRMPHQTGPLLMQKLCGAVEASASRIAANHRCLALVQEPDGHVIGVVAEAFGEERALRARKGVVLCTGGFIHNDAMIEAHAPLVRKCNIRVGAEGDDGSGIRLGVAAGADTLHMDAASISLPATQPWGLKRGILVNAQGQRFINEDAYYGRLGEWALFHHGGRAWLVVDDEVFEKPDYPREVTAVGDTVEELARELGLPPGGLESTVALYNRHAERGEDPLFHKAEPYLKPLTRPPFGAFDCTTENSIYAAFTLGGLATDPDGRVLDPEGRPIPGLFAAGRATSGLSVGGYSSGLSLGDGTFFGRRAGRCAAEG
jgi:3-oxo-5alpha-steroid 4-dehydrogenase